MPPGRRKSQGDSLTSPRQSSGIPLVVLSDVSHSWCSEGPVVARPQNPITIKRWFPLLRSIYSHEPLSNQSPSPCAPNLKLVCHQTRARVVAQHLNATRSPTIETPFFAPSSSAGATPRPEIRRDVSIRVSARSVMCFQVATFRVVAPHPPPVLSLICSPKWSALGGLRNRYRAGGGDGGDTAEEPSEDASELLRSGSA